MKCRIYSKNEFDVEKLISQFIKRNNNGESGAIYFFIGSVKKKGRRGTVEKLFLEAYVEAADEELRNICREIKKEYSLNDVEIGHAVGEFNVGEPIVYVAIAASSRENIYEAMKKAIELYKTRPPIFKKEIYTSKMEEWI